MLGASLALTLEMPGAPPSWGKQKLSTDVGRCPLGVAHQVNTGRRLKLALQMIDLACLFSVAVSQGVHCYLQSGTPLCGTVTRLRASALVLRPKGKLQQELSPAQRGRAPAGCHLRR